MLTTRTLQSVVLASRSSAGFAGPAPLTIAELEAGLREVDRGDVEPNAFWDENVEAFRQTVLVAMRETSEALLWLPMPQDARLELERQLPALRNYIRLADNYLAKRPARLSRSTFTH
jgi:hypothetical protein